MLGTLEPTLRNRSKLYETPLTTIGRCLHIHSFGPINQVIFNLNGVCAGPKPRLALPCTQVKIIPFRQVNNHGWMLEVLLPIHSPMPWAYSYNAILVFFNICMGEISTKMRASRFHNIYLLGRGTL